MNNEQVLALRVLVKAAFRMLDDSEERADGMYIVDPDLAINDLRCMADALDALDINDCDAVDELLPYV